MTVRGWVRKVSPWGAAVLTGLLLALCFPGWNQTWLCWIALMPLLWALWFSPDVSPVQSLRVLQKTGLGFCAGVTFFCMTFSWLRTVTDLMEPLILGRLAWFVLMCYLALYFAFWGWFTGCIALHHAANPTKFLSSRHNIMLAFACAAAWVTQEWLRGIIFSGFGWNGLGIILHGNVPLIQIADITGVSGLSFLVVMCNVIALLTFKRFALEVRNGRLRPHFDFTLTVALVAFVFGYGVHTLMTREASVQLSVAAVQANIPENEKFNYEFEDKILARYELLTGIAMAKKPQLIIWPEAATPRGMFADERNFRFVHDLAAKGDFNFLLGTIDADEEGDYNIAVLLTNRGAEMQSHRKMHLVPFGEYIPLRHAFPLFASLAGNLVPGDFRPGTEYNVVQMKNPSLKLGALICFEDTIGDLTRHFPLNGAQVLVNITNDAWFLKSVAAEQQLAHSVFRAAETHLPLVRCANTGVTCLIDRFGKVGASLRSQNGDSFIEGVLFGQVQVPIKSPITFYARHGEWLSITLCLATAIWIFAHFFKRTA